MAKENPKEDSISKMQPEERIEKLKKLEKEKKKEIAQMEVIIKESEKELSEKRKFTDKVPIPQVASEDRVGLSEDGRLVLKNLRGAQPVKPLPTSDISAPRKAGKKEEEEGSGTLEQTVAREPIRERDLPHPSLQQYWLEAQRAPAAFDSAYVAHLKQTPAVDLYREMSVIGGLVAQKGYATSDEVRRAETIAGAMEEKLHDMRSGRYSSFSEDVAKAASVTASLGSKIRNAYKGSTSAVGHDYYKGN